MITADELRGYIGHGLKGSRRVVVEGQELQSEYVHVKARERHKKWRLENAEKHRAYQHEYAKRNRDKINARVAKFAAKHPERRKQQLRAAAVRYWRKKHPRKDA